MKLEEQVVSLELAKELKEAGYSQNDSLFYWVDIPLTPFLVMKCCRGYVDVTTGAPVNLSKLDELVAVPTVAELGEIIGNNCNEWAQGWNDSGCFWQFRFGNRGSGNMIEGLGISFHALDSDTEADARAKCWLYLKKKGLIK